MESNYHYCACANKGPIHTIPAMLHSVSIFASDSTFVLTARMESDALCTCFQESNHYVVKVGYTRLLTASDCFSGNVNRRIRCIITSEALFKPGFHITFQSRRPTSNSPATLKSLFLLISLIITKSLQHTSK